MSESQYKAIIVGAGPAGLTAAYELSKQGQRVLVLESDSHYVRGISRTVAYQGYRFDIGGHRFFSKSREVEDLWTEILGPDMLERPRSSKIYYRGEFYAYPLKPSEALSKLGIYESTLCLLSFLKAKIHPTARPKSFEDWVVNQPPLMLVWANLHIQFIYGLFAIGLFVGVSTCNSKPVSRLDLDMPNRPQSGENLKRTKSHLSKIGGSACAIT